MAANPTDGESGVLKQFYSQIEAVLDPVDVGRLLWQDGLLTDAQLDNAEQLSITLKQRRVDIMSAVRSVVRGDPKKLWVLIAALEKFPASVPVANKMRQALNTQHVPSMQSSGGGAAVVQPGTSQVSTASAGSGDRTLEIKDLKDIIEYVCDLNMAQFKQLGLQLGLLQPTLDKLTDGTKPDEYGTKVMTEWLNQVDNARPTWNNLAKALDKKTVKAHVQATQIREDLKNGTIN